jgi:mRNA interferase RelE/StbE
MYTVTYAKAALRELKKLPRQVIPDILKRIERLVDNPRSMEHKKLQGYTNVYRLRQGEYRTIYQIRDTELKILVADIGSRRYIYRKY